LAGPRYVAVEHLDPAGFDRRLDSHGGQHEHGVRADAVGGVVRIRDPSCRSRCSSAFAHRRIGDRAIGRADRQRTTEPQPSRRALRAFGAAASNGDRSSLRA
jgi:hypothetical protein